MDFYELIIDMMLINIHLYIFIPTAVIKIYKVVQPQDVHEGTVLA